MDENLNIPCENCGNWINEDDEECPKCGHIKEENNG